ncbi:MAG: NIL domain-containing protein [Verrucomicrobiota bacterium]|nr:NIL domain-containing protein [Verrucomicrobiota bacterium]
MSEENYRFWLSYSAELVQRPLIWEMSQKFPVVFNIRQASVTQEVGIIALELRGERSQIKDVIKWFESQNVQVEPVELNTIEG